MYTNNQVKNLVQDYKNHRGTSFESEAEEYKFFREMALFVYGETSNTDLTILSTLLPESLLSDLIEYYDNSTISIPSSKQYIYCNVIIAMLFLRVIKKFSWKRIKRILKEYKVEDAIKYNFEDMIRVTNKLVDKFSTKIYSYLKDKDESFALDIVNSTIERFTNGNTTPEPQAG